MTTRGGGKPYKDQALKDGFNPDKGVPASVINQAKRAALADKKKKELDRAKEKEIADRQARTIFDLQQKVLALGKKNPLPPETPEDVSDPSDEDEKFTSKIMEDLRYGYRNSQGATGKKGRARLVELMENDGEFKFVVRELLKMQTALMAAKIRKTGDSPEGSAAQNFFVVLKGLEDMPKELMSDDKTINMKQISAAMNPSAAKFEPEEESKTAPPEQLMKGTSSE